MQYQSGELSSRRIDQSINSVPEKAANLSHYHIADFENKEIGFFNVTCGCLEKGMLRIFSLPNSVQCFLD